MGPEWDRILNEYEDWLTRRQIEHWEACNLCKNHKECQYSLALNECEQALHRTWEKIR